MTAQATVERESLSRDGFRFGLVPYSLGVEEELFQAADASRKEVARWMPWMHADYDQEECRRWVESSMAAWDNGTAYEFVIVDHEDGSAVGSCGLNSINRFDLVCNLGYWVSTSKCRLGAASQVVQLIWDFGIERVGLNRLEIVVADGNVASRGVAEKVGAIYEGIQRDRVRVGEKVFDAHMYACLRR